MERTVEPMKVICETGNYPNGQKICAAKLLYDTAVDAFSIAPDTYEVENRNIVGFSVNGNVVALDLDIRDEAASLIPGPGPRKPRGPEDPKPEKKHNGPPFNMPPAVRRPVEVKVRQKISILDAQGNEIPGSEGFIVSSESHEPVVEEFKQFEYKGIGYNLYIPENSAGEKLPLVYFLHDAGPCGDDTKITLSQGNGAITWAKPEWQRKHPCYVLAPQIPRSVHLTNDDHKASPELYILKEIIDHVADTYDVDKNRIYATGQSMGCMSTCEMNILWPDYFAASMLVAGQWDPERMGAACAKCNFWILVSNHDAKAFPGMNAVTEALAKGGAKVKRYLWNGKSSQVEFDALVASALKDDVNVRYTVFQGSTVVPEGRDPNPGANHVSTWPVAYEIEAVKEWLFTNSK